MDFGSLALLSNRQILTPKFDFGAHIFLSNRPSFIQNCGFEAQRLLSNRPFSMQKRERMRLSGLRGLSGGFSFGSQRPTTLYPLLIARIQIRKYIFFRTFSEVFNWFSEDAVVLVMLWNFELLVCSIFSKRKCI